MTVKDTHTTSLGLQHRVRLCAHCQQDLSRSASASTLSGYLTQAVVAACRVLLGFRSCMLITMPI
jgi:hypothetical protein